MPFPLAAKGAVVAVTVAVATAIAIYESPELRRYAGDVRRRIALAMNSIGEGANPRQQQDRDPVFNRPEDAEGFMMSRSGEGAEPGVDADEESRRKQREELLYWNSLRLQKQHDEKREQEGDEKIKRGSSFDDFMQQDQQAEKGTFVFNSGADTQTARDGLRQRGEATRAISASLYANPFADEYGVGNDEMSEVHASANIAPAADEAVSDIYSATTKDADDRNIAGVIGAPAVAPLIDFSEPQETQTESSATLDRSAADEEYMTASQDRNETYASIQAWAQDSSRDFYSPLPVTPAGPVSEPELVSDGELTPTDSMSLVGSGEDLGNEASSSRNGEMGRDYDVLSESEGMLTPASWSEVGSVVSESEGPMRSQ